MIRKALSRQGIHKNHVEAEASPKAKEQVWFMAPQFTSWRTSGKSFNLSDLSLLIC